MMIEITKWSTMDIYYHVIIQMDFVNQQQELHTHWHGLMKNFVLYSDYKKSLEEWQELKTDIGWKRTILLNPQTLNKTFRPKETKYPKFKTPQSTGENTSLSQFEIYLIAQTFCGKPEPSYSTQYETIFVTYLDGFDMSNGQPRPHSIIDRKISGKILFDTSNQKYIFPALNVSNKLATLDYDAHINTKIDFTINHVFKSMEVQELNTLHTVCELERTQLLTILAMSVKNTQLAGFLLTGNRSNFQYVEGSTAWLYDCPHFLSPLYKADKSFDRISIH